MPRESEPVRPSLARESELSSQSCDRARLCFHALPQRVERARLPGEENKQKDDRNGDSKQPQEDRHSVAPFV
jgi:hypothetical protein